MFYILYFILSSRQSYLWAQNTKQNMKRHLKKTVNENVLKEVRNENDLFIPRADQDEHLQDQFIVQLKVRRKFDQVDLKEIACIYMKDQSVVIIALNEKQIGI